ncbi:Iron-regulated protein A [Zhongshania aliphaticivorans]|uniref:Iron-regulated protein A n=1 Tax=Zhongshania aliphaticivorans TaxID=1470434 RepID=A0A5S9QCB5_9GAMM|nr:imelysin family protein [Zhongshania aliphaticivorans]CAA0087565.1 Iron-regulated protein A [Zhongshania aliphaticivorans]CAA0115117.1 Iron-regulated protein A [Zhongshania aliphaticivorans]CAA0119966.1 Iron-regulated protein A [Zhongshania aliphaticivorans]
MLILLRQILCVFYAMTLTFSVYAATPQPIDNNDKHAVAVHYTNMAYAIYSDAELSAIALKTSIEALVNSPSQNTLNAAKTAWKTARKAYQQSEAFRFGNPIVDDWEGQLNSWPLDEGLIDYVSDDYFFALGNIGAELNIIANETITLGGEVIDASQINAELLRSLHELGGSAANVTTGYHAIEFLLWGQDLNGHNIGAGERPYTDYLDSEQCTHGNCNRRAAYLLTATTMLVEDLQGMSTQWAADIEDNYRSELLAMDNDIVLARMLYGLGSLSLGELGGERIKVSLEANSTEDEHDCFSDNTHWSHYYNGLGIQNIYLGKYRRLDGSTLSGPSLSSLVAKANIDADKETQQALNKTMTALTVLSNAAEAKDKPMKFDMMIAEGNKRGEEILSNILDALVSQTRAIEQASAAIGIDPTATGI